MNTALIGHGYWGKILERYIQKHSKYNLKYILSNKPTNQHNLYINNIDIILNDSSIQAVIIATPTSTHYDLANVFLKAGKAVFCEKPLSSNYAEAVSLEKIVKNYGGILETNYLYSDSPGINFIRDRIINYHQSFNGYMVIQQFGRFYSNENVFETIGCHLMSAAIYFFGYDEWEEPVFTNLHKDSEGNVMAGMVELKKGDVELKLYANLIGQSKLRQISLFGKDKIYNYDMLSNNTVEIIDSSSLSKKSYNFDESNTIKLSLDRFWNVVADNRKSNIELSLLISKWLENSKI